MEEIFNYQKARDYYEKDCWGVLSGPDVSVSQVGSVSAGQVIKLYVRWENKKIIEAKSEIYGGPYLIWAVGFICEWLVNKNRAEIKNFSAQEFFKNLNFPENKKQIFFLLEDLLRALG